MNKRLYFTSALLFWLVSAFGQKLPVELTFSAIDDATWVQLDSIKVINRTQGDSAMLYWPDTTLTYQIIPGDRMLYVGYTSGTPSGEPETFQVQGQFQLFQNHPNPVNEHCLVSLYIPEKGNVIIRIADLQGRAILSSAWGLDEGHHTFRFTPGGGGFYILTAWWEGDSRSIKILASGPMTGRPCRLERTGSGSRDLTLKAALDQKEADVEASGILDTTQTSETYIFQFATNMPCPATPTVYYDGQLYNTIQVRSQCWLKENLNAGTMIVNQNQTNNGIIEKYCYDDDTCNCDTLGGLYRWEETMQYTNPEGTRGICPEGWHIPSDEEWMVLEGAADGMYGIGDAIWDTYNYRGYDAGLNLKSTTSWLYNGNGTDLYGFSALAGGHSLPSTTTLYKGMIGVWWTSTESVSGQAWMRMMNEAEDGIHRGSQTIYFGHSVRCIKDW
jgi:uncharacterized protein (TIGR02145 family)